MNRTTSKRRWFQFRLRTLLLLILVVSVALGGWKYWQQTRHMWRLQWAIAKYLPPESEESKLLTNLTWDREAWDSGLVDALGARVYENPVYMRTTLHHEGLSGLKWSGEFTDKGRVYRVYLVDSGSIWKTWPLICVITNDKHRLEKWQYIAERNSGFVSATINGKSPAVLRIRCKNVFSPYGYDYRITRDSIEHVDEFTADAGGAPVVVLDRTFDAATE